MYLRVSKLWSKKILKILLKNRVNEERTYFAITLVVGILAAIVAVVLCIFYISSSVFSRANGVNNATNAVDVSREGGEALLKGLFVADVGQNLRKPGQFDRCAGRDKETHFGHQNGQTESFQRYSFAASVWPGDGDHADLGLDTEVNGHDRDTLFVFLLPDQ